MAYTCSVWYPHMLSSHGSQHLLSAQRQVMLLISRAYRNTSTVALQVLTGLPPLDLQLSKEAEFSRVIRHGISIERHSAPFYHYKNSKHIIPPTWEGISLIKLNEFQGDTIIFTDGSKSDSGVGSAFCAYKNCTLTFECKHVCPLGTLSSGAVCNFERL